MLLVIKHTEHQHHSEHWSKLISGKILITSYCPDNRPPTNVLELTPKEAVKGLRRLLTEDWIIVFNTLFVDGEV